MWYFYNQEKTKGTFGGGKRKYSHADRKGMLILPWMLLIATMWPCRLLIMEGRSAKERSQRLYKSTFLLITAPNAESGWPHLLDFIGSKEVNGESPPWGGPCFVGTCRPPVPGRLPAGR